MEVPAPLKWAAAIISGIAVIAVGAYFNWLTNSVNTMSITLARMDERMASANSRQDAQFNDIQRRINRLEQFHEAK